MRRKIDALRHDGTMITPIEAALATLRLKGSLPNPLIALEPFGMMGLRKTLDYIDYCQSLDFYDIYQPFADAARSLLPPSIATIHCEDSVAAVRDHRTPRCDYNFLVIDNPIGSIYGPGYCEHFDMIPAVFDTVADDAVIIANTFRSDKNHAEFEPDYVERRKAFYGVTSPADAMRPRIESVIAAYQNRLPPRLRLRDAFTIAHPRHPSIPRNEMHFIVLVLAANGARKP